MLFIFFRTAVRTIISTPPPKRPRRSNKKKEKPQNVFSTRENFTSGYEVNLTQNQRKTQHINPLRIVLGDGLRAVNFMYNCYTYREQKVRTPALFFSNYYKEPVERLSDPANDDGWRELNSKFYPKDIPSIKIILDKIIETNAELFENVNWPEVQSAVNKFLTRINPVTDESSEANDNIVEESCEEEEPDQ